MSAPGLVEHFFRHEYGRLVATLSRRVGIEELETVEDAVQFALMKALNAWTTSGLPDNPSAWLYRVALNHLLGVLRKSASRRRILERYPREAERAELSSEPVYSSEIQDDVLRMLFVCCDPAIPIESQIVLALKTLCGFSVREIAFRLFTSEANVYKRLDRARTRLRQVRPEFEDQADREFAKRRPAVQKILYLLFTEGYLSNHPDLAIRKELCREAIRMAGIMADHQIGQVPETFALLALMHLHMARMTARQKGAGGLLLLEEQDRSLWDRSEIQAGLAWLAKSSEGDHFSRYHAEAGIAAEHCLARSFEETRWDKIVGCYELLERQEPSAIHKLNKAVALAEWRGAAFGLAELTDLAPPPSLEASYQWSAVLADLNRRSGLIVKARHYECKALASAPSPAVRDLLNRRFASATCHRV